MNNKLAKKLRRLAREEMAGDQGRVDRELVVARIKGKDRVVNEPNSDRAMYLQLKKSYAVARRAVGV